jgi:WD40 repeat protein
MMAGISRTTVVIALSFSAIVSCVWIVLLNSTKPRVERRLSSIAVSCAGNWLAAGTAQGKITVWNETSSGAPHQVTFPYGSLNDLRFSPDGHVLAIASGNLGVYAPEGPAAPRLLRSDNENYGSVRFSQDGQKLLVINGRSVMETIDAHSGLLLLKVCCSTIYGDAAFTPDGQDFANAGHWPGLWDAHDGRLLGRFTIHREFETFRPIAFDKREGTILMGSQDGRVYIWNLTKRTLIAVSPPQPDYVDTLAVSNTGWVIFAAFGKSVELWNPKTGQHRVLTRARPTSNLVLGADGKSIIFGTAKGDVEFWDISTGKCIRSIKAPTV